MCWGTSSGTVNSTRGNVKRGIELCSDLEISPPYPNPGPFPVGDYVGFTVALQMLASFLLPGKYHETHQQFDTIRTLTLAY